MRVLLRRLWERLTLSKEQRRFYEVFDKSLEIPLLREHTATTFLSRSWCSF